MFKFQSEMDSLEKYILIVDDVPDNCWMLQTFLEMEGYKVKIAKDGYEALNAIASHPPALVLLDMMMPGITGLEVAKRVRENQKLPFIPIVMLTAWENLSESIDYDSKVDGLITKPIDFEQLFAKIESFLPARPQEYVKASQKNHVEVRM
ncbi:response regulator [Calothrix sp. UHCC 0171]|uniref:response regulator n=1 Tax=Calothrix sp. UHCC 0171 TaxID=3110245 RepID=UPI002B1FE2B5|nr:response regulator [Calothrix sp. UHCC 0171]MEA5572592.1 response regulator [Calothrix sp. UHCC 0171]